MCYFKNWGGYYMNWAGYYTNYTNWEGRGGPPRAYLPL